MSYTSAAEWRAAKRRKICLFGMSGLGKTHLANMLRATGHWYHYSVDYRIGTRYLGEAITDNAKRAAMQVPMLRELLRSDSLYIGSNISFENLAPLSTYMGKPGDPARGGLEIDEYRRRQAQHRSAEIAALQETGHFIARARSLYDYPHFICDTGGSICEVVRPEDPDDPVLRHLSQHTLLIWLKGDAAHRARLIERFDAAPKPMYYDPAFLDAAWADYLRQSGQRATDVDPDAFIRWTYARALDHRQPRYAAMAKWGITLEAEELLPIRTEADFTELIASKLT